MSHLPRREFLATAGAGVATLALAPLATPALGAAAQVKKAEPKKALALFALPPLPYAYDALEPTIDKATMEIHHDKHHKAYVDGLNAAIKDEPSLSGKSVGTLLMNINTVPMPVRQRVINMGGGHLNHTIFWQTMGPKAGGEPTGALAAAINKTFKSFDGFKKAFHQAALTQFGSGWAWLVRNAKKEVQVLKFANQDSPYMTAGLKPLLGIDVWEHAYYLKYKNDRAKYVTEWWKVVNWKAVAARYA